MASTSQTTNHRIYCAVTGTLPPATMSRLPGKDAVKKIAQRARMKMNPRPRAPVSLAGLVLEEEDNLSITEESTSWYLDGTFKSAPQLSYQLLVLHAELTDTPGKSWIHPTVYILLIQKYIPIYLEAFKALLSYLKL